MVNSINNILKYFKAEYVRSSLPPFGIVTIFCFVLIAKNILVQWQISYLNFTITVGLLLYPLTFLITDYVNEIYGKRTCMRLVLVVFIFSIVPSIILSTIQIIIGSMLAYLMAQFHDVWAFNWWKEKKINIFVFAITLQL